MRVVGVLALAAAAALSPCAARAAEPGLTILDAGSFWRFHVTLRKPVVPAAAGRAEAVLPVQVPYRSYPGLELLETEPPAAEWAGPDFDDSAWARGRVAEKLPDSIAGVVFAPGIEFSTGSLCLRGKFQVEDPAAVEGMTLSVKYRGGIVVYVNGTEVARQHLPAGKPAAASPGAAYPPEAFVDSRGKPIPGAYHAGKRIKEGEKELAERLASRERRLGPVAIPAKLLRKGVNVLAIELHRSDYHPSALSWFQGPPYGRESGWAPIGLIDVRLAGSGAVPNTGRPKGLQVWNQDVNDRVTVLDYGDPNERLQPVSIVGCRNGAFSGQVVVGSTEPLKGLKAEASDLVAEGGRKIAASQVKVRFPFPNGQAYHQPDWFDGLRDTPAGGTGFQPVGGGTTGKMPVPPVQPIWVTVRVPREAAAGDYSGILRLTMNDQVPMTNDQLRPGTTGGTDGSGWSLVNGHWSLSIPLRLRVADWALPEPRDFRTYVGVYQSPTSLALRYRVAEWSEGHWRLMEQSFELLGQLGNKLVNIPLSDQTQFGNDEGLVFWVRKADGSFDYDFSVFDRYIKLVRKHLGVPDFVALQLWHSGGWEARKAEQQNTVTVIEKATGKREHVQVPPFGTEESKRFWKPVLDAIRERLAKEGMDKAMCLGILSDGTAPSAVFKAFDEIMPGGAVWMRGCHSSTRATEPYRADRGGGRVVCHEFCYGMAMADPAKGLPPVWRQRSWPGVAFIRHNFDDTLSLLKYRTLAERSLYCGTRGFGRMGLDYWNVVKRADGKYDRIFNRWPHSSCAQREPNLYRLADSAPDGPAPTVRFEQVREGIQEAEAMIVVAEAVGEHPDKLGPGLAAECRQLLVDRLNYARRTCPEAYGRIPFRTNHYGWQGLAARLFNAAAKVAPH